MTVALDFDSILSRGLSAGVTAATRQRDRSRVAPSAGPLDSDREGFGLRRSAASPCGERRSAEPLSCLVLSADAALRRRLTAAAELAGWRVEPSPADGGPPVDPSVSEGRLLVVDLASPPPCGLGPTERFAKEFASRAGSLLVVCGAAGSVEHEAWARSMGAFVHVPGVAAGDSLVSWFTEARVVSERRHPGAIRPTRRRSFPVPA